MMEVDMSHSGIEGKLKTLFELQRFSGNSRLQKIIDDTEAKYKSNVYELSDADLLSVSAAGDPNMFLAESGKDGGNSPNGDQ